LNECIQTIGQPSSITSQQSYSNSTGVQVRSDLADAISHPDSHLVDAFIDIVWKSLESHLDLIDATSWFDENQVHELRWEALRNPGAFGEIADTCQLVLWKLWEIHAQTAQDHRVSIHPSYQTDGYIYNVEYVHSDWWSDITMLSYLYGRNQIIWMPTGNFSIRISSTSQPGSINAFLNARIIQFKDTDKHEGERKILWIGDRYVNEDSRDSGLGKAWLDIIEKIAKDNGCEGVCWMLSAEKSWDQERLVASTKRRWRQVFQFENGPSSISIQMFSWERFVPDLTSGAVKEL